MTMLLPRTCYTSSNGLESGFSRKNFTRREISIVLRRSSRQTQIHRQCIAKLSAPDPGMQQHGAGACAAAWPRPRCASALASASRQPPCCRRRTSGPPQTPPARPAYASPLDTALHRNEASQTVNQLKKRSCALVISTMIHAWWQAAYVCKGWLISMDTHVQKLALTTILHVFSETGRHLHCH